MRGRSVAVVALAVVICICGCSQPGRLPTAPVRGTVTLDGDPVTSGMVLFLPERGRAAQGEIGPDGVFVLGTYGASDGAILGMHRVAIVARDGAAPSEADVVAGKTAMWTVPERYTGPETSGLIVDVQANASNECDLRLTSQ